jgi:hypothetical protein
MPTRGEPDSDEALWSDEEEPAQVSVPAFTELKAAITSAIAALGGAVMPKLNWSAPKVSAGEGKERVCCLRSRDQTGQPRNDEEGGGRVQRVLVLA